MITLTTPRTITVTGPGAATENDSQGVNTSYDVDFVANTVTFRLDMGAGAPSAFVVGQFGVPATVVINLTSGHWDSFASTGNFSGTVPAGPLANFVAQAKAARNAIESFAAANSIMPGSQTPWA